MTNASRHEPAGIAWPPILWIDGLPLGSLLALLPAYFSWSGLSVCLVLH